MVRVRVGFVLLGVGSALVLAGCSGEARFSADRSGAAQFVHHYRSADDNHHRRARRPHDHRTTDHDAATDDDAHGCAVRAQRVVLLHHSRRKLPSAASSSCPPESKPGARERPLPFRRGRRAAWSTGATVFASPTRGEGAFMCSGGEVYTSGGPDADPVLAAGQPLSKLGFTCTDHRDRRPRVSTIRPRTASPWLQIPTRCSDDRSRSRRTCPAGPVNRDPPEWGRESQRRRTLGRGARHGTADRRALRPGTSGRG